MKWLRKLLTGALAIVLIVSLLGLAISFSLNSAFSSPNHLKTWAQNSNFYGSLLTKASSDTAVSLGNSTLYSQLNPVVRQNLKTVFPETQFNQYIDKAIDANYAWLKGKTTTPSFVIDVTQQKLAFAGDLGNYVQSHYASLPKCSAKDLASLTSTNPLTLSCQVPTISANLVKTDVVSEIESSNIVVRNTVITADSIKHNNQPYYTAFNLPSAYKHLKTAPIFLVLIALICTAGVIFFSQPRRKSAVLLGGCLATTGLILIIASSASSSASSKISSHITNGSNLASFKDPVDSLIQKAVSFVNGIDLWFGIGYLVLAFIVLIFYLARLKGRAAKRRTPISDGCRDKLQGVVPKENYISSGPSNVTKQTTAPVLKPKPSKRKLIQ